MLIFDAHLDLAMNAIEWNRDLCQPLESIRAAEAHLKDKPDRTRSTVSFPELRKAGVGICVATQIARIKHGQFSPVAGWNSQAQAWAMTQAQLAWYQAMEEAGELIAIRSRNDLDKQLIRFEEAQSSGKHHWPIGYILSLEGADSLITLQHLERAYEYGLRAIGPAHYGPGVYANGTDSSGGLTSRGRELIQEIQRLGMILDATHLCDDSFWEAMSLYDGPVWGSHQNCRHLVDHNRQWSDDQIKEIVKRGGILGAVFDAWMITPGWKRGQTTPEAAGVTLSRLVEHIDRVCQIAGNTLHAGIGSDLDGAFGNEQTPQEIKSIANLPQIFDCLRNRGYRDQEIQQIAHGNFLRFARAHLP